jgi:hypothetical protein
LPYVVPTDGAFFAIPFFNSPRGATDRAHLDIIDTSAKISRLSLRFGALAKRA